jgi:hypothetical protein
MMKCLLAATAVLGVTLLGQDGRPSASLERPFVANGSVAMDLSAGDYHIIGRALDRVRLEWRVRETEALAEVRASADVSGRAVKIRTDGPGNKGLRFTIEVPNQSDLHVRLTAGDLTIEDIRGNKDVELRAGDLNIDVGQASDYKKVDASLWAGDIEASAFQIFKGGLFRSFEWAGSGPYRLHAHLMAGDLHLYSK